MMKGADPGAKAENGETIWHVAAGLGNLECLGIVINYVYFDLREYLDANLKSIKKETGIKKSDVRLGKLLSPDAHMPEVQEAYRKFLELVLEQYNEYWQRVG